MNVLPQREVAVGDVVDVTGHNVGDASRLGEILEVLASPIRPHFRIRWDDGHESVFYSHEASIRLRADELVSVSDAELPDIVRA